MGQVLSYVIPAVLAFLFAYMMWLIRRERYRLEYSVSKSAPFPIDSRDACYFVTTLENTGNRPVTDITVRLCLHEASIVSVAASDPALLRIVSQSSNNVEGIASLLNPGDSLQATLTAVGPSGKSALDVTARGTGATAVSKTQKSGMALFVQLATVLAAVTAIVAVSTFVLSTRQTSVGERVAETAQRVEASDSTLTRLRHEMARRDRERSEGKPEPEELIISALVASGLSSTVPDLMSWGDVSYWKTGLFLACEYARNPQGVDRYTTALSSLLNAPNVAPSSKGFILYLLSRIERERGNTARAEEYLARCKHDTPLMYDHLMQNDSLFVMRDLCSRPGP